jgi:hypothetical protein
MDFRLPGGGRLAVVRRDSRSSSSSSRSSRRRGGFAGGKRSRSSQGRVELTRGEVMSLLEVQRQSSGLWARSGLCFGGGRQLGDDGAVGEWEASQVEWCDWDWLMGAVGAERKRVVEIVMPKR